MRCFRRTLALTPTTPPPAAVPRLASPIPAPQPVPFFAPQAVEMRNVLGLAALKRELTAAATVTAEAHTPKAGAAVPPDDAAAREAGVSAADHEARVEKLEARVERLKRKLEASVEALKGELAAAVAAEAEARQAADLSEAIARRAGDNAEANARETAMHAETSARRQLRQDVSATLRSAMVIETSLNKRYALDVAGSEVKNMAVPVLYQQHGGNNQKWFLVPSEPFVAP